MDPMSLLSLLGPTAGRLLQNVVKPASVQAPRMAPNYARLIARPAAAPVSRSVNIDQGSGMPSWVLPVAGLAALYLLTRKK